MSNENAVEKFDPIMCRTVKTMRLRRRSSGVVWVNSGDPGFLNLTITPFFISLLRNMNKNVKNPV